MKNDLKRGYTVIRVYCMEGISISLLLLSFEELLWSMLKFPSLASYLIYFLKCNLLKYRNISWVVKQSLFQEMPRDYQISIFNHKITRNSSLKEVVLYVRVRNRGKNLVVCGTRWFLTPYPKWKALCRTADLSLGMDDWSVFKPLIQQHTNRDREDWIPGFLLSTGPK